MTTETKNETAIATESRCLLMRSGREIWLDVDSAQELQRHLNDLQRHKFVYIKKTGESINTADLEGIYKPETMKDASKRRNGQRKCPGGKWHDRYEKCNCAPLAQQIRARQREDAIRECGKCTNGYIMTEKGYAAPCDCQKQFISEK